MRFILAAAAAVTLLVGVAASQPAEARCFWNGFNTVCVHRPHYYGWDRPHFYRDYDQPYWRY